MSENHFAYPWFEKCHLTHLRYVSITLRNPPRSLPLQKHLLTPKQNITRIKTPKTRTPKTQTLLERETRGAIRLFVVVWSVWRERKHLFCIIKAKQGMCDCCIWVLDVNFLSRPTHIVRFCCSSTHLNFFFCMLNEIGRAHV